MRLKSIYALYKNDEYITSGTKEEIANYCNVSPRTIMFYLTPTYSKRGKGKKGNRKKLVKIGYVGDEE